MGRQLIAGIETGGTKLLARIADLNGEVVADGRWATSTSAAGLAELAEFLEAEAGDGQLAAIGIAAFGPLLTDPSSPDYGLMLTTTKPGWSGSNLRADIEARLDVPVVVDSDVNAAAIAEQAMGAGEGLPSVAYVTVGTGIGAGLAINGKSLTGVMHPEGGHLPHYPASGRRNAQRLPISRELRRRVGVRAGAEAAVGGRDQPLGRSKGSRNCCPLSGTARSEPGFRLVAAPDRLGRRGNCRRSVVSKDRRRDACSYQRLWSGSRSRAPGLLRAGRVEGCRT